MAVIPSAPTTLARIAGSVPWQLDDHVRGLDHRDRAYPGREAELVGRFTGNQGNEPMGAGLHLDLSHDAVFDNARDDAREMIAGGSADGGFWLGLGRGRRHEARELPPINDALATGRPDRRQPSAVGQPANTVDADAEQFGDLTDLVRGHSVLPTLAFARFP